MKVFAFFSSAVAFVVTAFIFSSCNCCWDPCCDPCCKPVCCPKPCAPMPVSCPKADCVDEPECPCPGENSYPPRY